MKCTSIGIAMSLLSKWNYYSLCALLFLGMTQSVLSQSLTITEVPKDDGAPDPNKLYEEHLIKVKKPFSYKLWIFPGGANSATSGTLKVGSNKIYMDVIKVSDRDLKIEVHQVGEVMTYSRELIFPYSVDVLQPERTLGEEFPVDPSNIIGLDGIAVIPKQFSVSVMESLNYIDPQYCQFGFFWNIAGRPALQNKEIHGDQFQVFLKCASLEH